jgi:hypothetical protein
MSKWFRVIDDTIDLDSMMVEVEVEGKEHWQMYKIHETKKGWYINLFGKREYILVPSDE